MKKLTLDRRIIFRFGAVCLVTFFFFSASAKEKRFSFENSLRKGDSFQCRILSDQVVTYSFQLQGRRTPLVREEVLKASFSGFLQVLELNGKGDASRIRLRMDLAHGSLNGKPLKISSGRNGGILIRGDLSGRESAFQREDGRKLTQDELSLLQALFRPPSGSRLSDFMGKERVLPSPGQGWKLQTDSFLKDLAKRQIFLPAKTLQGGVTYQGMAKVGNERCHRFGILLGTTSLKEYDFRLKATVFMKEGAPVPLRIKREAREVLLRTLQGNDPFAAGSKVELRSHDVTEQTLLPVSEFPVPLLPLTVPGGNAPWKKLLR